jgi:hypothetical protein
MISFYLSTLRINLDILVKIKLCLLVPSVEDLVSIVIIPKFINQNLVSMMIAMLMSIMIVMSMAIRMVLVLVIVVPVPILVSMMRTLLLTFQIHNLESPSLPSKWQSKFIAVHKIV